MSISNPFRIGNWLNLVSNGKVINRVQVAQIDGAGIVDDSGTDAGSLQPIIITEKVLQSFGFKNLHGKLWSARAGDTSKPISVEFGALPEDPVNLWVGKVKVRSFRVLHLHRLQNIAADLCDLELQLNK